MTMARAQRKLSFLSRAVRFARMVDKATHSPTSDSHHGPHIWRRRNFHAELVRWHAHTLCARRDHLPMHALRRLPRQPARVLVNLGDRGAGTRPGKPAALRRTNASGNGATGSSHGRSKAHRRQWDATGRTPGTRLGQASCHHDERPPEPRACKRRGRTPQKARALSEIAGKTQRTRAGHKAQTIQPPGRSHGARSTCQKGAVQAPTQALQQAVRAKGAQPWSLAHLLVADCLIGDVTK